MTRTTNRKTSRSALAGLAPPLPLSHHQPAARPHPHQAPPRHASASILLRLRGACAHAELVAFTAVKSRVSLRVFTRRRRGRCTCVARASRPCPSRARLQICGASQFLWSFLRAKRRTRRRQRFTDFFFWDLALLFMSALQQLHYETLTTTTIIFTFHLGLWQRLLVLFSFYIPHCFIPSSLNSICIIIPYNSHAYVRLLFLDGMGSPSHVHIHSLYSHSHSLYCKSTIPLYPISIHHASSLKNVRATAKMCLVSSGAHAYAR